MPSKAQRLAARLWHASARCALLTLCLWPAVAVSDVIARAEYAGPTDRYAHGVLGDAIEHETLVLTLENGEVRQFTLPRSSVFEDTAPRLADLDRDGAPEVIVVESDASLGARLSIYTEQGFLTATPYIGTRFRWLAPLGAADLDGDGHIEIAFVDRPHLVKTLRIWRFEDGTLTQIATRPGLTNHRIGERDIAGGIRECGQGPEMILADAGWSSLLALRMEGSDITASVLSDDTSRASFARAMDCADTP